MRRYNKNMSKVEFATLMTKILEQPTLGYKNAKLGLKLSDFRNWDDWFGFGEWDDGNHDITCEIEEGNVNGARFLSGQGFKEE